MPHSEHGYCEGSQQLGSRYKVLMSTDRGASRYDAFDVTVEKPFSEASKWGATVAYTNASVEAEGLGLLHVGLPVRTRMEWPSA